MKFWYYLSAYTYNYFPSIYFKWRYHRLHRLAKTWDLATLQQRLDYYYKPRANFALPTHIPPIKEFKKSVGTGYYLDLKAFLHYFNPSVKLAYCFGDDTHINPYPTLFKARPIFGDNQNSVLFKLNKKRHFYFVNDALSFEQKINQLVWRGGAYQENRKRFVQQFWNHPMCNVGQTNQPKSTQAWEKNFLSIPQQLKYKFIFCPEGNDVATNLKWAMSSNSLCIMPMPKYETWFMEGTLQAGVHFVEVKEDFSDLISKMEYYIQHPQKAQLIIQKAQQHVTQFLNKDVEDYLCIKVIDRYLKDSRQLNYLKYSPYNV